MLKDQTKEQLIKLLAMLRKKGDKGIRREEISNDLQNAITIGIQHGLITRERRKFKRIRGITHTSIWLVATVKNPQVATDIDSEKSVAQDALANERAAARTAKRRKRFKERKKEFWKQACHFPAYMTIKQRLEALADDDLQGLNTLWTKVWEYYGFGTDISQKVYNVVPVKPTEKIAAKPHVQGQNFNLDRGEFRQTVKKLLAKGMITPATQDYILNKINAVPVGDYNQLMVLRDKVYTYYSVEDNL